MLVLHGSPESFNENIITPCTLAIHTDANIVFLEILGESQAGELVTGWIFAVIRFCTWWVYVIYLPIYAVESGYTEQLGGILLSVSNAFLFLTPLMLRAMRGRVRKAVLLGFAGSGVLFLLASFDLAGPALVVAFLVSASIF